MWLIIGILVGALGVYVWQKLTRECRKLAWYCWALILVGLADLLVTVESVSGSVVEGEPTAAVRFAMIGGIILILAWGFAWRLIAGKTSPAVKAPAKAA